MNATSVAKNICLFYKSVNRKSLIKLKTMAGHIQALDEVEQEFSTLSTISQQSDVHVWLENYEVVLKYRLTGPISDESTAL
jgi:hypothetical protein